MGLIRGGLFYIVCVLLVVSLILAGVFITISKSLSYENLKTELTKISLEKSSEFDINSAFPEMQAKCLNNSGGGVSFSENSGFNINIPCTVVSQGSEAVLSYAVDSIIGDMYYKEYDCGFFNCFKQGEPPIFLISQHSHDYFKSKFYLMLLTSLVLIILLFFLVENKPNFPITTGIVLIISSLPFMKLDFFSKFFIDASYLYFLSIVLSNTRFIFLIYLISGIALVGVGIGLHFYLFGESIAEKIEKWKSKKKEKEK